MPIWVRGLETERVLDHYEWHQVGPDHLFHAATYEMMARQAPRSLPGPPLTFLSFRRRRAEDIPEVRGRRSMSDREGGPILILGARRRTL